MRRLPAWLLLILAILAAACASAPATLVLEAGPLAAADPQPRLPLRAAFYYPWYPEAWQRADGVPYTNYRPVLGAYDSADAALIRRHIAAMQYGGIAAGIVSWWGQGSKTDGRLPALLAAAQDTPFRWAVYHELEGSADPSPAALAADLAYLREHYARDPAYLRIKGRFVVFVYGDEADGCAMAGRWRQANAGINAYLVLKTFPGYRTCRDQPDGWHQYAPANAADRQGRYSYTISPGFSMPGQAPRLPRDLLRWRKNIRNMVASGARFQLITSFNEWGEGTAVEPAEEWASPSGYGAYLDALHDNGARLAPSSP